MMKRIMGIVAAVLLGFCPAWAEYYQYSGTDGSLYFTDNIAEVPEEQRSGLITHESILLIPSRIHSPVIRHHVLAALSW